MKVAVEVGPVATRHVAAALTISAGVVALVSWYQAWFTLHYPGGSLAESPYALAQDPDGRAAWLVLGVGIALTVLGVIMIAWQKPLGTVIQTALTVGLLFAVYLLVGEMGVLNGLAGHNSSDVTLVPEWGIYLISLSFVLSLAAAILLWRQMRSAGNLSVG